MSTQYQSSRDVPAKMLAQRLDELSDVVASKRARIDSEFTMRVPAECDRDADLVMAEAARRLRGTSALVEALHSRLKSVADQLNSGFVVCQRCGDQEDTATLDCVSDLKAILDALATYRNHGGDEE